MEAVMNKVKLSVLFAVAATLAACSDNSVAPRSQAADAFSGATQGYRGALSTTDTTRFSITLIPGQSTLYYLGDGNSMFFPAGSVCDPASTYGASEWDNACAPISGVVTVNVREWLDAKGHARADFLPHLRFVPSLLPTAWVTISFKDFQASLDPFYNILYCATDTSGCFDESKTDASLLTVRDAVTGKVTRRIKHFSGYMVGAGDDSTSAGFNRIPSLPKGVTTSVRGRP
jgi:hypothetical protein